MFYLLTKIIAKMSFTFSDTMYYTFHILIDYTNNIYNIRLLIDDFPHKNISYVTIYLRYINFSIYSYFNVL